MHSSIIGISSIYGREEEVSFQDKLQFIFILRKELVTNEDIRMITMMHYSNHQLKRYGFDAKDYFLIKEKIQKAAFNKHKTVRIILVTDPKNCQDILNSSQNRALQNIEKIFVFTQTKDSKRYNFEDYKNVIVKCIPVRAYINGAIKIVKDCKEKMQLFRSMIFLGDKRQERLSYLLKVWVKSWLSIKPSQYQDYLEKYNKCKIQLYGNQSQNSIPYHYRQNQIYQIQQIITLMRTKFNRQFSKKSLQLYQQQQMYFYTSLNNGVKNHIQDIEYSEGIALPFNIVFKAIKTQFHHYFQQIPEQNPKSEKPRQNTIDKLFESNDQITLWRWAKIGDDELKNINTKDKNGMYIEFMNFTSASLSKQTAIKFRRESNTEGDCLLKITLKKPQFKQQLQNFPFIYLSFAYLQDIRPIKEYEILLNALTVAKVIKLSKITYSSLGIPSKQIKQNNQQLYLIELQIGEFYELLKDYSNNPKDQKFTKSERDILQNYLITLEALNQKQYDIGRAYELSGHQSKAYDFYSTRLSKMKQYSRLKNKRQKYQIKEEQIKVFAKKIDSKPQDSYQKLTQNKQVQKIMNKPLQKKNSIVDIDQKVIEDIILLEDIDEVRDYQFLHNKLALICSSMGKQNEAIENSAISIKLYDTLRETDKSLTIKEHQQMRNKFMLQHVQILSKNDLFQQAYNFIQNRIKQLEQSAARQSENSLLYHFIIAEVNIIKGLMKLFEGKLIAAKHNFAISKMKTDHIKKEIKYESLKNQTFYFQFIIDLIIFRSVTLRYKNEYFRYKRALQIEQATKIFGGKIKFQNVANNSQNLLQTFQEIDSQQKKKQGENEQKSDYNLVKKIEESAIQKSIKAMQPAFKQFLNNLDNKVNQQDGNDGYYSLLLQRKINLLFLESNDSENIGKIESQFEQLQAKIIQTRLKNWQIQRKNEISLKDTILKIKRTVIQIKDKYKKSKINKGKIMLQYQQSIKNDIEKYLQESKKWGYTEPLMDEIKQGLKLIKINYELGKKEVAIKQLKELFEDIKKVESFRFQTLEGYILNININFEGADMAYLNIFNAKSSSLIAKTDLINKSAQQLKNQKLIDCLKTIEKALKFAKINFFQQQQLIIQQQNILAQISLREKVRKSLNSIQNEVRMQNKKIYKKGRAIRSNKVAEWKHSIQIMRIKCNIELKRQIQEIQLYFNQLQKIKQKITQNHSYLQIAQLQVKGLIQYYRGQQNLSFSSLNQCFNKMKINCMINIKQKVFLLTKIFFLLPNHIHIESIDNNLKINLQIYQSQLIQCHFYWRILLAQYVAKINDRRGLKHNYIKKCKYFIDNESTKEDDSQIRKSLILAEYQASREKQKLSSSARFLNRKSSINKPSLKHYYSMEQTEKISSKQQQEYNKQIEKINQDQILYENSQLFYKKPQNQKNENSKIQQQGDFGETLKSQSIKGYNKKKLKDDQEQQFLPTVSQQLQVNPQYNKQEGLQKQYKSDELRNDHINVFSRRFNGPQIQKKISRLRQSRRNMMNNQLTILKRSPSNTSSQNSNFTSPKKSIDLNNSPLSRFLKSPTMIQYSLESKKRASPTKQFMNKMKEIIKVSNSIESSKGWMSISKIKRQNSRQQMKQKIQNTLGRYGKKKSINQTPEQFSQFYEKQR